jgi:hypothetical protein
MIKIINLLTGIVLLNLIFLSAHSQIDSVIVETYYISGSEDTVSFDLSEPLREKSITYRIFVDLAEGSKLLEIFGSQGHPFIISGSEAFFNNTFRGQSFGYRNNEKSFAYNTTALDSWLTLGMATRNHFGVLKTDDTDGSMTAIKNNIDSVLNNDDPDAGIPISKSDGFSMADSTHNFTNNGILDIISGEDTTIFGVNYGDTIFKSTDFSLRENTGEGIEAPIPQNRILIAQLTTTGTLSFTLNLRVRDVNGNVFYYFGKDTLIDKNNNERFSSWLKYPFELVRGCMDPYYAEYNPDAVIDDGSCQDSVIFGCLDIAACNYNPDANVHLDELCCFNSECELDLEEVCPGTIYGCTDPEAVNYNQEANATSDIDDCCYRQGCMDDRYLEYDRNACYQDSTDCRVLIVRGCTDKSACNYNPVANRNIGCDYSCFEDGTKSFTLDGPEDGNYSLRVYPNPVENILTISLSLSHDASIKYEIINLLGQNLLSNYHNEIAGDHRYEVKLENLNKGVYYLRLTVNNSISVKRIIKQ